MMPTTTAAAHRPGARRGPSPPVGAGTRSHLQGHRRGHRQARFDYFIVEVAPHGGPPLHVHHRQEETIHVLNGRFKVRIGDELFQLDEGGFAYLPSKVPHAFLNLTDEPAEIIVVYTPGGGHKFYEELGPAPATGRPTEPSIAAIFEKHGMSLLGPPLSAD